MPVLVRAWDPLTRLRSGSRAHDQVANGQPIALLRLTPVARGIPPSDFEDEWS